MPLANEPGDGQPQAASADARPPKAAKPPATENKPSAAEKLKTATFGTGCFWCTEAIFEQLKGVQSVVSGYSGGMRVNPTYEEVCSGMTGHAEVVQINYDPAVISFEKLLEVFWDTHDPTTLNRQGNDIGTQYRSVIFYHDEDQLKTAQKSLQELDKSGTLPSPIVTQIAPFTVFYAAEPYHQDYYKHHSHESYCRVVIRPKLQKFKKNFSENL